MTTPNNNNNENNVNNNENENDLLSSLTVSELPFLKSDDQLSMYNLDITNSLGKQYINLINDTY